MPDTNNFKDFNSYKQARKTLKRIFKTTDVSHVSFTGGEPLMAERFSELVLYTRMKKKSVTIISNGNFAGEQDYKQLIDIGVGLFELPVHSPNPEAHDFMTQRKGSWNKSVESTKLLLDKGAYVVSVIVITKANYKQIGETLKFINQLGINRVMLNRFNIGGEGIKEKDNLLITNEQLNSAFKQASIVGKELKISLSSNVCTPLCIIEKSDYPNIVFTSCSPDVTKRPLTIDILGNLRFCNHSPVVLGNIFKDDLKEMLNSKKALEWNNVIPDFCADCNLYESCMGGCRAAGQQLNLSLKYPDPILIS